jgi:RIP metalloprotease RseP
MKRLIKITGQMGAGNRLRLDWIHDAPGLAEPVEHPQDAVGLIPAERVLAYDMSSLDLLGIYPEQVRFTLRIDSLGASLGAGLRRARDETQNIFRTVRSFFAPKGEAISAKNLGGFIMIFRGAHHSLDAGPGTFLIFLGIISINLAVLNLLPIPVLDGGLLLLLTIEKLRGGPLSEKTTAVFQYAGLALILPLVLFVTYNDIVREISLWW